MKTAKLKDFYPEGDYLSNAYINGPILKALSEKVEELEVDKNEFVYVMGYGISNSVYHYVISDGSAPYHMVLGMRLKII